MATRSGHAIGREREGALGAICHRMGEIGLDADEPFGRDQIKLVVDEDQQLAGGRDNKQRRMRPEAALAG